MKCIETYDRRRVTGAMNNLWQLLDDADKKLFEEHLRLESFKRNERIYREGDSPDCLLCLIEGKVKIYRDGLGGRCLINRVLRPVQYFGYRANMAGEPYITAAAAFEESTIALVPMSIVNKVMARNQKVCAFFIRELAVDLGIADKRIVSLTQKHVRARLAETLLSLKGVYGLDDDGKTLDLYIPREDLAALSNMTASNAIRTLSEFSREGLIEVQGRSITLLDEAAIARISEWG